MLVVWVGWEQGFFMGMRRWGSVGPWYRTPQDMCGVVHAAAVHTCGGLQTGIGLLTVSFYTGRRAKPCPAARRARAFLKEGSLLFRYACGFLALRLWPVVLGMAMALDRTQAMS